MSSRAALLWNRRLEAWRRQGSASTLTRLLDRALLALGRGALAIDDEELRRILRRGGHDESGRRPRLRLEVVGPDGARRLVEAGELRGIERQVRWVDDGAGTLGLVGGRPLRALQPPPVGAQASPAVRLQRAGDADERLLPFARIALVVDGE